MSTVTDYSELVRQQETQEQQNDYVQFVRRREAEISAQNAQSASELGQAGLGSDELPIWTRMRMSQGSNITEKVNALQKAFPEAELVESGGQLVFRTDPSRPWSEVDPNMMERFEPLADIAEFLGADLGTLIGEGIATIGTKGRNLLPIAARMAAGAAAGKGVQEGIQTLAGEQEQTIGEIAGGMGVSAGLSAGGAIATAPIVGLINSTRGAGLFRTSRQGNRALRAEGELGIENTLSVGQTIDNPLIQKMEKQSAALISAFPRRFEGQRRELVERVVTAADRTELISFPAEVERAVTSMEGNLIRAARRAPTTSTAAGEQVQEGIQSFLRESQQAVSAAYRAAEAIEDPVFDLANALTSVKPVADGQFGTPTSVASDLIRRMAEIAETPGPLGDVSYTQRLRNLRSEAYEAGTPEPGFPVRAEHRQAKEIYRAVDDTLKDPTNTNMEFREAWASANRAARKRFETVDKLTLIRGNVTETAEDLARRLTGPYNAERLQFARSVIGPEKFGRMQEAFKNELLNTGRQLRQTLDRYDDETLSLLLGPQERRAFNVLADQLQRLDDLGVQNALRKQTRINGFVSDVLDRGDTAAIDTLATLVRRNGGKKSALGRTVRAAVLDLFAERVITRRGGSALVSPNAVNDTMKQFRKMGLTRFLELEDGRFMRNIDAIAPAIAATADAGTSIQAAEVASGIRGFAPSALRHLVEAVGAGRLFLNPHGRKILLGVGTEEPINASNIRLAGAALTQALLTDDFQDLSDVE